MNISGASPASGSSAFMPGSNDEVKLLERQKSLLQKEIEKTNESKMDDKSKLDRIQELQEQIQQVDLAIQQKQTERIRENSKPQEVDDKDSSKESAESVQEAGLSGMTDLLQANSSYS